MPLLPRQIGKVQGLFIQYILFLPQWILFVLMLSFEYYCIGCFPSAFVMTMVLSDDIFFLCFLFHFYLALQAAFGLVILDFGMGGWWR